jgi:putative copper resistance protein D
VIAAHGGVPASGYDGPPALTWARTVTAWEPRLTVIVALVGTAALYLWAARRLRRRGDAWSVGRDIAFVVGGLGTIALATLGWMGVYDDTLFWAHMAQHMTLSMVAPIFLALGAPVTLALRTLRPAGRRRLTRVLHSLPARILVNPIVGFVLVFGTPFVLYDTGLYQASLTHDWLHNLLHLHFVFAGCVFFWPIVGVDPVPGRLPHPMRLLLLCVSLPAHAWLGVSIMSQKTIIAGDYYRALGRPWPPSLAYDQTIGGGLLWAAGDLVGLLVFGALLWQWSQADEREAVRSDRRLDREERLARQRAAEAGEEAALSAYNQRLAALAEHSAGDRPAQSVQNPPFRT